MNSEFEEWSAGHVVDFHEWAGKEGRMNASTAAARGSAVKRVFEYVYGEEWPSQSVKDLDEADLFLRFRNKAKFDVTPKSMETYEGRFTKAIESYTLFNKDQTAWAQSLRTNTRAPRSGKADKKKESETQAQQQSKVTEPEMGGRDEQVPEGLTRYPFPLQGGVQAQLYLPTKGLTGPDVKRLTAYLQSLVMEEQPALMAGSPQE
ncbi:hypothetical protein [Egicoccus halophilus]|uniref:Core-binding (CB) domain-containing protein n=1 Tax=Egicoccus halophilus TaxID=1670830 RepID=A0A8J3ABL1_9ACTN|nr:hypothetical protein [Egicoccus halophilus]GGI09777.1 hypothetical protein GCM10011354_35760 [Egicoccus halophilus]